MVRSFWWGQNNGKNKIAWSSWDKICVPKTDGGLGFRDLKAFNLALLAKQGWHLQTNTSFLVLQVFKARYFPERDFISTEMGSKPSYAWRSIMAAQKVVQHGYRWQVGNGNSIKIWADKWLPTCSTFRVTTHPHALHPESHVSSLIDHDTGNWRIGLIKEIFLPHDAQAILSIPLSIRRPPDRMVWAFTFTVNSAYKVALSLSQATTSSLGSTSNNHHISVFWKTIWRLKVPSKIRSFAWRARKNLLPTKSNLHSRRVLDDPTCELCGNGVETTGHALWACDKAQDVWRASGIPVHGHGLRFDSFLDLLWHLIFNQHAGDDLLGLTVTLAWSLWLNRNKARTGGSRQTSAVILQLATSLLDEYRLANHRIMIPNVATHTTWTPPHSPWYKVNVDGAVFQHLGAVGIGVVARDHTGQCMAAMSKKMWVPLGPLEAEAKAMEEEIDFAWDVGLCDVVFEIDSEILHRSLTGSITPPVTIQNIVNSCIMRLQDFRAVQLTHVRRNGNKPAHLMSQHAKGLETFVTWIENILTLIESALTQDLLF